MKESVTVVVVTRDPEQFLKYRNVTNIPMLCRYITKKKLIIHHVNVYSKGGVYLRREYPAETV